MFVFLYQEKPKEGMGSEEGAEVSKFPFRQL